MITIKKHSENVYITVIRLKEIMQEQGKTRKEIDQYVNVLLGLPYDDLIKKINKDFEGILEVV